MYKTRKGKVRSQKNKIKGKKNITFSLDKYGILVFFPLVKFERLSHKKKATIQT